jgi:beta-N-acetylhexosaminidase
MRKVLLIVLAVILMINTAGCGSLKNSDENEKIDIRGLITNISINDSKMISTIMVEGKVESDTIHDKASIRLEKKTKISKGSGNQKLSADELKEGMKVEVIFDGPVAESYPVQGKAKSIRVIE